MSIDAAGVSTPAGDARPANNWNRGSTIDCWPTEHTDGHNSSAGKIAAEIEISAAQGKYGCRGRLLPSEAWLISADLRQNSPSVANLRTAGISRSTGQREENSGTQTT
jgi:hypothetical protein